MNRLPKSWAVLNDGSDLFDEHVTPYMNLNDKEVERNPSMAWLSNMEVFFYGMNTSGEYCISADEDDFDKILSIEEFIELSGQFTNEDRYRLALEEIADPIRFMRERLQEGYTLDGGMAIQLSNSANYLKEIARKALGLD